MRSMSSLVIPSWLRNMARLSRLLTIRPVSSWKWFRLSFHTAFADSRWLVMWKKSGVKAIPWPVSLSRLT